MNIFIATPAHNAENHVGFTLSALRTQAALAAQGIAHTFEFDPGNAPISRARNILVAQFMARPEYTHLMFIDGDMGWTPEDLLALVAADKEVACAGYVKRGEPKEFTFTLHDAEQLEQCPETGFIEIKGAPTGFILIRRSAIERMFAAYPELKCRVSKLLNPAEQANSYALFNTDICDGTLTGEDLLWSRRWHDIGGQIWMHPEIALKHFDGCRAYQGRPSEIFVQETAERLPIEAIVERAARIDGWMTPAELAWLAATAAQMGSVVEIGSWQGRSTAALLASTQGPVLAVDHWQGGKDEPEHIREHCRTQNNRERFLANVGGAPNLVIADCESLVAAYREFPGMQFPADMVFIDGGHGYEEVRADIRAWLPRTRRVICGHDFNWPEVRQAVIDELGPVSAGPGSLWFHFLTEAKEQAA